MASNLALREDIYGGGPNNDLLRRWLAIDISREMAEKSLSTPSLASSGSFILRRSSTSMGNYAVTVVEGRQMHSYKIVDLGLGQVSVSTGQAFASLEHLLEFFYDNPFPELGNGHVPLRIMHPHLVGAGSNWRGGHASGVATAAPGSRAVPASSSSSRSGAGGARSQAPPAVPAGSARPSHGYALASTVEMDAPPVPNTKRPGRIGSGDALPQYTPMADSAMASSVGQYRPMPAPVVAARGPAHQYSQGPDEEFEESFRQMGRPGGRLPGDYREVGPHAPPMLQSAVLYGDDGPALPGRPPKVVPIPTYGDDDRAPAPPKARMISAYGDEEEEEEYDLSGGQDLPPRPPMLHNIPGYGDDAPAPQLQQIGTYGDGDEEYPLAQQDNLTYGDASASNPQMYRDADGMIMSPLYRSESTINATNPPLPPRPGQRDAPPPLPNRPGQPGSRGKLPPPPPAEDLNYGDAQGGFYGTS